MRDFRGIPQNCAGPGGNISPALLCFWPIVGEITLA